MASLSFGEVAAIVLAAAPLIGVLIAGANVLVSLVSERKRTQPIVICHEDRARHFREGVGQTGWVVDVHVQNEGAGAAFNVRFGVELHGIRFPYKLRSEDPDAGNVQRVVTPGERRPLIGAWEVDVPSTLLWSGKGDPDPGRVYWARYENAQGHTWETQNPGDRSARLNIRRVRRVDRVERREEQAREQARREGVEWEKEATAQLRAEMEESAAEDAPGSS